MEIRETPHALEISVNAATKLKLELPTDRQTDIEMESIPFMGNSSLAEDIHVKTQEASQNTELHMLEFSGIDKVLQTIQVELGNNTSKLIDINKHIKKRSNG